MVKNQDLTSVVADKLTFTEDVRLQLEFSPKKIETINAKMKERDALALSLVCSSRAILIDAESKYAVDITVDSHSNLLEQ